MRYHKESGQVFVTVALSLLTLLGITALSVDFGQMYFQRWNAQLAADAAALSGVKYLYDGVGSTAARTEAHKVVLAHGFSDSEIEGGWDPSANNGGIQVGNVPYNSGTNTFGAFNPNPSAGTLINAVRVKLTRNVAATFSKAVGSSSTTPRVKAVAGYGVGGATDCALPLAIDQLRLKPGGTFMSEQTDFEVEKKDGPGNHGPYDPQDGACVGDNAPLACAIDEDGNCGEPLNVGDQRPMATGNDDKWAQKICEVRGLDYVLPIANSIPNGKHNFTIIGFIKVKVKAVKDKNGNVVNDCSSNSLKNDQAKIQFTLLEYVLGNGYNPGGGGGNGFFGYGSGLIE